MTSLLGQQIRGKQVFLNGINLFIFIKHLVVLKGTALASLACEDLCSRSFWAQTAQFSLVIYQSFREVFLPSQSSDLLCWKLLNLDTSSEVWQPFLKNLSWDNQLILCRPKCQVSIICSYFKDQGEISLCYDLTTYDSVFP